MFTTTEYLLSDEANVQHLRESISHLAELRANRIKSTKSLTKRTALKVSALKQVFHLLTKEQQEAFFKAEAFANNELSLKELLEETKRLQVAYSRVSALNQRNYDSTHKYNKELANAVHLANAVWLCLSNVAYDWQLPIVITFVKGDLL